MCTKKLVEAMVREVRIRDGQPIKAEDPALIENLEARVRSFVNEQDSYKAEMRELIKQQGTFDPEWDAEGRRRDLSDALDCACVKYNHAQIMFSPTLDEVHKWKWIVRELTYLLHKK